MRRLYSAIACILMVVLIGSLVSDPLGAASNKELQHLKGTVGYQPTADAPFSPVAGSYVLPDDAFAVTQDKSAALLTLPDSSLVAFGQNTRVQVGAFNQAAQGPGSTVTVNGGTLRFDIRRPQGGAANYRFITPTSTIGVRGTVGLLSLLGGNTTVACLACAADSLSVSVGGQTFALATGQMLTVSASGAAVLGPVTSSALNDFSNSGVSTSPSSGLAAATSGVSGAAGASLGAVGAAAAAAAAGVAAGVVTGSGSHATPAPVPVPLLIQGGPALPGGSLGGQRRAQ